MNDAGKAKTLSAIQSMTDATGLRQVMKNAQNQGHVDLYKAAFRRRCEVLGQVAHGPSDTVARRLEATVCAIEDIRGGRSACRTRPMIKRRGAVGTIKQWLTYKDPIEGYRALVLTGLWDLLGEAIPLDFPEQFTDNEIAVARYRLADAKQGRISEPFLPALKSGSLFGF